MTRSLAGLDRAELAAALAEIGVSEREQRMRVSQIWNWIYFRGARDFEAMTNVSKDLRAKLAEHFTLERPEVVEHDATGALNHKARIGQHARRGEPCQWHVRGQIGRSDRMHVAVAAKLLPAESGDDADA